jgi:hypothetical protein
MFTHALAFNPTHPGTATTCSSPTTESFGFHEPRIAAQRCVAPPPPPPLPPPPYRCHHVVTTILIVFTRVDIAEACEASVLLPLSSSSSSPSSQLQRLSSPHIQTSRIHLLSNCFPHRWRCHCCHAFQQRYRTAHMEHCSAHAATAVEFGLTGTAQRGLAGSAVVTIDFRLRKLTQKPSWRS